MTRERRVLIVDDDFSVVHTLRRVLEQEGILVSIADDGRDALQLASEATFDAALVDYQMPDMDGLQVLSRLREIQPQCLRLLVSGNLDVDIMLAAVNRGEVARVIRKPFNGEDLVGSLNEAFATQAHIWKTVLADGSEQEPGVGQRLQACIDRDAFKLALQPIVGAKSLDVVGFEALLRSSDPEFGSPLKVFSVAEALGLIDALADVVAEKTLAWFSSLPEDFMLFINLHPFELNAPERIAKRTQALYPWAKRVVLEITERERIVSQQRFTESIEIIRGQQFALALDDLGAGYSSLSMMVELRPDYVKVDRSLVRDIHLDSKKQELVGYLVEIAKRMGSLVVGEGVEKLAEASYLRECGVDLLQGFLFGRPSFEPQTVVTETAPATVSSRVASR